MRSRRTLLLVVLVACSVVLAGCGGLTSTSGGDSGAPPQGGQANGPAKVEADRSARSTNASVGSAVVRMGSIHTEASNTTAAEETITELVRSHGGSVSESSTSFSGPDEDRRRHSRVVFRVPAENFSTVFERTKAVGAVTHAQSNSTDVADQLTDLDARLRNLRAQRDRLRALYENASDTEAVLAVSEKLSNVQSEIERLEARQAALKDRVAYSTLTVELSEPSSSTPQSDPAWHETGVVAAFLESVDGVVAVCRAMVVGLAYLLPYLLVFGLPLIVASVALRRWRLD